MSGMATPPESTRYSLHHRLAAHARQRWPQVADVDVRFRGAFAYVEAHLADGTVQPLIRLRYSGSAQHWGFGLYLASSGRYEDQILPTGLPIGSPEEALDRAGSLYLGDPA
jgi:hypothetical protein